MPPLSVLMTTEGTYPYGAGGVSTWCDALLRNTPDVRYDAAADHDESAHREEVRAAGEHAGGSSTCRCGGSRSRPSSHRDAVRRSCTSASAPRAKRTSRASSSRPSAASSICVNAAGADPAAFGRVLLEMESYFRRRDYNVTMKSAPVWELFRATMEEFSGAMTSASALPGREHQMPSLFDLTECLRWLYRFLIVLDVACRKTSVTHSTAAAFCGIPCITAKLRHGTPMILTEHGVYLREQNLFLSRFRRLFFCKQFLLNLITAVVRANYFFADVVSPVCHYNTRWEARSRNAAAEDPRDLQRRRSRCIRARAAQDRRAASCRGHGPHRSAQGHRDVPARGGPRARNAPATSVSASSERWPIASTTSAA